MTTAREQGQAAGVWQVIGQGRVCFCAGHKERSPPGTKRVKNVSIKAVPAAQSSPDHIFRLAALAGSLLPSERSWVPSVSSILSEGTSPLFGSESAGGHSHFNPFFPFPFQLLKQQRC